MTQLVALERLRQESLEIKDFDSVIHVLEGTQCLLTLAANAFCMCWLADWSFCQGAVPGIPHLLKWQTALGVLLPLSFYITAHPSRQSICMKETDR